MTLLRTILNALWGAALIAALNTCFIVHSVKAETIPVSHFPVASLLMQVDRTQNVETLEDGRARLRFEVTNDTPDTALWYFQTEVLEPLAFSVFADGQTAPILVSPFHAREQASHASQGPSLRSDLMVMAPGETRRFEAVFEKPPGPALFPIRLTHKDAYDAAFLTRSLTHGFFFGAMMALVLLYLLSPNFLVNAASKWFAGYLASLALLSMHSHGYGLIFLNIPPEAYFPVLRLLHTCIISFYLFFVLSFLKAAQAYPMYWRGALLFLGLGLCVAVAEQLLGSAVFQTVTTAVPGVFLLIGGWGAWMALRDRVYGGRFFMVGFVVLVLVGVLNFAASFPPLAPWNEAVDRLTALMQIGDALIFGGALLSQMYGLRRARDQAVEGQMTEMQRRLDLGNKLLSTEGDLRRARDLAERHRANLAETSHDLRQPIAALRLSLQAAQERSPEMVSDLSAGVEFLDRLLGQTLDRTRLAPGSSGPEAPGEDDSSVDLQVILLNAQRMFAAEAGEKGVALTIVPTSLAVRAPTIDLIRILSNLTANAVRYTETGRVLIGARRRNGCAAIEVWDTGSGVPAEQLEDITRAYVRGTSSGTTEGEGLGLSIAKHLIDRNGLALKVRSTVGRGSVFAVEGLVIAPRAALAMTNK